MTADTGIVEQDIHRPFGCVAEIFHGAYPIVTAAHVKLGLDAILRADFGFHFIQAIRVHVVETAEPAAL